MFSIDPLTKMHEEQRETLGEILRSKKFFVYVGLSIVFDFTLVTYAVKDLWTEFYKIHEWGTKGLVMGNCLGFFASNITLISWILVDENSWLGKAVILLVTSVSLTICGAYFTIEYFNYGQKFYNEHRKKDPPSILKQGKVFSGNESFPFVEEIPEFSAWMPVLAGINFMQGIVGLMFFLLVCLSLDGQDESLQ